MNAFEVVGTYMLRGVESAVQQINQVGQHADQSSQRLDQMGNQSRQTGGQVNNLGDQSQRTGESFNRAGQAAQNASGDIRRVGSSSQRSSRQVRTFSQRLDQLASDAGQAANRVSGFAGTVATALSGAAIGFGSSASETVMLIDRYSRSLGISAEEFQKWAVGAKSVGQDMETFGDQMTDLQRNLADMSISGGGPFQDFLDAVAGKVDININKMKEMSGPQVLQFMVNAMREAGLSGREMGFVLDSVGSDLDRMIPLVENNGAKLRAMANEAKRTGQILDGETLESMRRSRTAMSDMGRTTSALVDRIGGDFAPMLEEMNRLLEDFVAPAIIWVSEKLEALSEQYMKLPEPIRNIIAASAALVVALGPAILIFGKLFGAIRMVIGPFIRIAGLIFRVGRLLTPAGLLISGVIALVGWLIDWGDAWDYVAEKARSAINWISEAIGLGKVFNEQSNATPAMDNADADTEGAAVRGGSTRGGGGSVVNINNPNINGDSGLNSLLNRYGSGLNGGAI